MIRVDPARCCYCGGCVSVCYMEALTLDEMRLVVSDDCIDCGDCVSACPAGALHTGENPTSQVPLRRKQYHVLVVGAGPGGSMAALAAARAGLEVLLIEKRQEIGSPVRCAEGVGRDQLESLIDPDPRWIAAEVTRATVTAQADGVSQTYRAEGGRGYVLERRVFDRDLAARAALAGADVRVKTAATGLLLEDGRVQGVQLADVGPTGAAVEVAAQVVIAADGVESQMARWAGLDTRLPLADTMVCAQYLLAGVDVDPECTAYTIGCEVAPGGYAWVFPKGDGLANVGLGIQADLPAPGGGTALALLHRFVESDPRLARGCPVTLVTGNVPVAPSPARLVAGGLMLVGDAARQVDPLTGGGIVNAMVAGKLAGQVAAAAIEANDPSAEFLARYSLEWQAMAGRRLQRNYRLRQRFPPDQRCDERFVHAFMLAAK